MSELFLKIINMSISASWLILAVLILRLVLKKAPKWVNVLLWGIVAVRLICPFSFESALSLIPSAETFPEKVISGPSFDIQTGISPVDNRINDYLGDRYFEGVTVPANNGNNIMTILTIVWIIGILLLVAYTIISYRRLHREIDTAVHYKDNIFQSENVSSPFVLGIINPRIYLPFSMNEQDLEHVVAHEQAHIRRKDHWWKPLGFLLLTIYWFNPLMWLAYVLLCRDIELACDEKVIKELGNEQIVRIVINGLRLANLLHNARLHDHYKVGYAHGLVLVMGNENGGYLGFALYAAYFFAGLEPEPCVKV